MKNKSIVTVIGAMVMVLTTLLYVLLGSAYFASPVYWIAFTAVLVMEFAGGMLLLFALGHPRRVAAAVGVLVGAAVTLAVSMVYIVLFPSGTAFFAAFVVLILAVAGGQALILWKHDAVNSARQAEQEDARAFFESCRNVVSVLRTLPEAEAYNDGLRALEDDLRYADDSRRTEQDGQIKEMLTTLSNGLQDPGYDPTAILGELRALLRQRQRLLHP